VWSSDCARGLTSREAIASVVDALLDATTSAQGGKNKALFLAATHDSLAPLAGRLITGGADVEALRPGDGYTPLCIACKHGNVAMVERLIGAARADMVCVDDGFTPLHIAAQGGHAGFVSVLIETVGVALNAALTDGELAGCTPLFVAAQENRLDVFKMLIAAGADVNMAGDDGDTPLFVAAYCGHAGVVYVLIDTPGVDLNAALTDADMVDVTPSFVAAENNRLDVLKLLIAAGADVNKACAIDGYTHLLVAAQNGNAGCVPVLLEAAGVDPNVAATDGCTPLYIAAQGNRLDVVTLLIAAGADVDKAADDDYTPLQMAAQNGHSDDVGLLIAAGANVHAATTDSDTALSFALAQGHAEVVQKLRAAGSSE
jgi:ankyrin repeat protein